MKKFRTVLFNGYEKKEVDEYIEFLEQEMEKLKEETNRALDHEQKMISELKSSLEMEQGEKSGLKEKLNMLEEKRDKMEEEYSQKYRDMEERIRKYEGSYESVSHVLNIAQSDAQKMLSDAQTSADKITMEAQVKARIYQEQAEEKIKEAREANEKDFMLAKYKLMEYLDAFNRTQGRLIETYNDLGEIVKKMPIRMEDVFSEKPLELLKHESPDEPKENG